MNKRRIEIDQEKRAVRVQQIALGRRDPPADWYGSPEPIKKVSLVKGEQRLLQLMGKVGFRYGR